MDYSADETLAAPNKGNCPVCSTRALDGALFCAACGAFLKAEDGRRPQKRETRAASAANGRPATTATAAAAENLDFGFVQLMGEITHLQRDLLRQFRQGQALQARQFERALQAQALGLEKTLAHVDTRVQASEERLHVWQRWSAGLGVAVVLGLLVVTQIL